MVKNKFYPKKGDVVIINFNPTKGHEQKGKRPALVISSDAFNQKSGFIIVCPITSKVKNYPFELSVNTKKIKGVILSDQLKSIDWIARKVEKVDSVTDNLLKDVLEKINLIIN